MTRSRVQIGDGTGTHRTIASRGGRLFSLTLRFLPRYGVRSVRL